MLNECRPAVDDAVPNNDRSVLQMAVACFGQEREGAYLRAKSSALTEDDVTLRIEQAEARGVAPYVLRYPTEDFGAVLGGDIKVADLQRRGATIDCQRKLSGAGLFGHGLGRPGPVANGIVVDAFFMGITDSFDDFILQMVFGVSSNPL